MTKYFVLALFFFVSHMISAQEPAKYRITYNCDAKISSGKSESYRWTLDIGETSAVFFNESYRAFYREMAKIKASGDVFAVINQLPALGKKYSAKNDLQIVLGLPENGKYTYYKKVLDSKMKYEETLPTIEWHLSDSTKTICEYECKKAEGIVYGRTWTVWYSTELPLNYGPYILNGLPGLIMAAKDADGLFDFCAVGIENAPEDATISVYDIEDSQKCSRKRFMEMRSESDGMSYLEIVNRVLSQNSDGKKPKVSAIHDENGKEISNDEVPKKNFLDKE